MRDIWGFLLQSLTVTGVAVLLLVIKAVFRDKLPPKWHFAVWGVLGVSILLPAGLGGRYTLINWRFLIELVKPLSGEYEYTRVSAPVPVVTSLPGSGPELLFTLYAAGVAVSLLTYAISYWRLRRILRRGGEPDAALKTRVWRIAGEIGVRPCDIKLVSGLSGAFVCGVFCPILALPARGEVDDKIILHELTHLKNRDSLWSVVICVLRSLHWCNPVIAYCASEAAIDMEARCDQQILEDLAGEERREYGRLLIDMADCGFPRTAGTTCVVSGARNIRKRIESISRFKKYPVGMGLVSICIIVLLLVSTGVGAKADVVYGFGDRVSLASARSTACTTPAGAFDAYGKAVLECDCLYRVLCAPESEQDELAWEVLRGGNYRSWDFYPGSPVDPDGGYFVFNLKKTGDAYEGLLVVTLFSGDVSGDNIAVAYQRLLVEEENGRWVAIPQGKFERAESVSNTPLWGCPELPGDVYAGESGDLRVELKHQTIYQVESSSVARREEPIPDAEFGVLSYYSEAECIFLGSEAERDSISQIGLSLARVPEGEPRPTDLPAPDDGDNVGVESVDRLWGSAVLEPGWGPTVMVCSGGSTTIPGEDTEEPGYWAADIYINSGLYDRIELDPKGES